MLLFYVSTLLAVSSFSSAALAANPYPLGIVTFPLTDKSRNDPFNATEKRELMVTVTYPLLGRPLQSELQNYLRLPIFPPASAEFYAAAYNVTPEVAQYVTGTAYTSAPFYPSKRLRNAPKVPVIIASPGAGSSRILHHTLYEHLAGLGYMVVAVDHPYEAEIVEFNDGRVKTAVVPWGNMNYTFELYDPFLNTRKKDLEFVIRVLNSGEVLRKIGGCENKPGRCRQVVDFRNIGGLGYSVGGTAVADLSRSNKVGRLIKGWVNMDGFFRDKILRKGSNSPFLIISAEKDAFRPWPEENTARRLKRKTPANIWHKEVLIEETGHASFLDLPYLIEALGITTIPEDEYERLFGTIGGIRSNTIMKRYVEEFFNMVLKGEGEGLLSGPSSQFPEVVYVP